MSSGYDEMFVDALPEYLKCAICRFVLRDPVQLLECGHQFCCCCFNQLKEHSSGSTLDLFCPLDGKVVDCGKVVKDKFAERIIADLHVYCKYKDHGCNWSGELRHIDRHKCECPRAVKGGFVNEPHGVGDQISAEVIKQIFSRLDRCEEALMEKDKDVAHLKFSLKEANEKIEKREEELVLLKEKVLFGEETRKLQDRRLELLTKEVDELKTENTLHKECDHTQEIGELCVKINSIEKSCKIVDNDLKVLKEEMKELKDGIKNKPTKVGNAGERSLTNVNEGAGAGNVSLNLPQHVNYSSEKYVNVWEILWNKVKQGEYTYSPEFYCNNKFPCKLGACRKPGNRMEFIFVPQNVANFPSGTTFNIQLDACTPFVQYQNLCNIKGTYEQHVGYLLLHTMDEREYIRYVRGYHYSSMKCTWSYEVKQDNK